MLKTDCPHCHSAVFSPLLSEVQEIECTSCGKTFKVKDVYVTAGPYSIFRDVLLKHRHKYIRLLREAHREADEIASKKSRPYVETQKTVNEFVSYLHELLAGGRDSLRVSGEGLKVAVTAGKDSFEAGLVNISTTGACIGVSDETPLKKDTTISLLIKEKGMAPVSVKGVVVWRSAKYAGIRFVDVGDEENARIRDIVLKRGDKK